MSGRGGQANVEKREPTKLWAVRDVDRTGLKM
jgi:hypothetical protein